MGMQIHIAQDSLYGDAMGPPGTDEGSYPGMLLHNASVMQRYLMRE